MARLGLAGCEIAAAEYFGVGALTLNGNAPTRDTGTFRTGAAAWKCDSGVGNNFSSLSVQVTNATSTTYYVRGYFNFANLPGTLTQILVAGQGAGFSARLTTGGKLRLYNDTAGTQIGSDSSATLTTGTWYRIELSYTTSAGATNTYTAGELMLDGVSVASTSGLTLSGLTTAIHWGWFGAPGASLVVYVDDIAFNDSTGGSNNSWPGSGKVILMCPTSDNARGAWTGGAGGTTNLFDAVNNSPPVGVAEASATNTSQIKNRTATNPTSYDGNLASYTTAGIGASDTVNAIVVIDVDGEDPATGTKTGACSMVSNPAIAEPTAFNFGDDAGLQGTFLGLWKWHATAVSQAPSVTLGTQPVIRMRCISGATTGRSASCCFLGAYVDYTPFVATQLISQPCNFQNPGML